MRPELVPLSKFISKVLRHRPDKIGLTLDQHGWAMVDELIQCANRHNVKLTRTILDEIVATNDKQRFSYSQDGLSIRANQGHSIPIDLELDRVKPPDILYHGTAQRFWPSIQTQGLRRQRRLHVHLSPDPETALSVGKRHGEPIVLKIYSQQMHTDGFRFFLSANGVWLTEFVPPNYISEYEY